MDKRKIEYNNSSPFFINTKGSAYLRSHGTMLQWGDFAAISGLPSLTSMTFRKHMSNVLTNQNNVAMVEMEEFSLCHSGPSQKKNYADPVAIKAKSVIAQAWYAEMHAIEEDPREQELESETLKKICELQRKQVEEMNDQTVKDVIEAEMTSREFVPRRTSSGKLLIFGKDIKGSLLDAIVTAQVGTKWFRGMCPTILDDLFVPGKSIRSKKSARILLRMMSLHKQDWWSVLKLRESMCSFATIMFQEDHNLNARSVMVSWAEKMIKMLWRLSYVDHLTSASVKLSIAKAMATGGPRRDKYFFGNPNIKHQLRIFVERLRARNSGGAPQEKEPQV